ncbi:MAG TPA: hypothetical protein VK919_14355, partial [Solirubrobacterales bacterium]|nr:hypothetical protein [Solirubrobacterales bacterium]
IQARPPIRRVGAKKKRVSYRVRATNIGDAPTGALRLCAKAPRKRVQVVGASCRLPPGLDPGGSAQQPFKLKLKRKARGKATRIRFTAQGAGFASRSAGVRLRVRR